MKRYLIGLLCFIVAWIVAPAATAAENWKITKFHSDIALQTDGTVKVVETLDVDFGAEAKHGIFRDIPYAYESSDGTKTYTEIDVLAVSAPYEVTVNDAAMRLKIGDASKTVTGRQSYRIEYVVTGVLRSFETYDELYWNVTGHDWPVTIEASSASVTLPEPGVISRSCYTGLPGSTTPCGGVIENEGARVQFNAAIPPLPPSEGLTVAVGYTKGMVPILTVAPPPGPGDLVDSPVLWIGFLVTLGLGGTLLLGQWWRYGRDQWWRRKNLHDPDAVVATMPFFAKETITPEYEAPDGLRPAEMGVLVDERADTLDVSATIVDLAVRGYLTITEIPKKWRFGSVDYSFSRTSKKDSELLPYEQTLIKALFAAGTEVKLSSLKNQFHDDLAKVKEQLYKDITNKKLFTKNPNTIRNAYLVIGGILLAVGIGLTVFGIASVLALPLGIGPALAILGIMSFIVAFGMPSRTAAGRELYRRSLGYKLFVSGTEKYRQPFFENQNIFMEVLPYAIVFGVTKKLAEAMQDMGIQPSSPTWYVGARPFNVYAFSTNMDSFSRSLSSVIASTPSSSGSGGGGFSGGGFGGGGGGSW